MSLSLAVANDVSFTSKVPLEVMSDAMGDSSSCLLDLYGHGKWALVHHPSYATESYSDVAFLKKYFLEHFWKLFEELEDML